MQNDRVAFCRGGGKVLSTPEMGEELGISNQESSTINVEEEEPRVSNISEVQLDKVQSTFEG